MMRVARRRRRRQRRSGATHTTTTTTTTNANTNTTGEHQSAGAALYSPGSCGGRVLRREKVEGFELLVPRAQVTDVALCERGTHR